MPNPEAVAYIQDHLGEIPDPDVQGQRLTFVNYQQFPGQFEEQQKLIEENKRRTAAGLALLLEQGGYSIVKTSEIRGPSMIGSYPQVKVQCKACGQTVLTSIEPISSDGVMEVSPFGLSQPHVCP